METSPMVALADLFSGLLITALSLPLILGKVPANHWYGSVFSSALKSDQNWLLVNGYGAKRMLCWSLIWAGLGLVALVVPAATGSFWFWLLLLAPPVLLLMPVFQTFRFGKHLASA